MSSHTSAAGDSRGPDDPQDLLPETSVLTFEEYLRMQRAIGDDSRFRLLYELVNRGRKSASELSESLEIEPNRMHYHLDKLVEAGLVEKRKRTEADESGLYSYYRATSLGGAILEHGVVELMRREREFLEEYGGERTT